MFTHNFICKHRNVWFCSNCMHGIYILNTLFSIENCIVNRSLWPLPIEKQSVSVWLWDWLLRWLCVCHISGFCLVQWPAGGARGDFLVSVCRGHGCSPGGSTTWHLGQLPTLPDVKRLFENWWYGVKTCMLILFFFFCNTYSQEITVLQ